MISGLTECMKVHGGMGGEREGVEKRTVLHCNDGIARGGLFGVSILATLVVFGRRGARCGVISGHEDASACGLLVSKVQALILRSDYGT